MKLTEFMNIGDLVSFGKDPEIWQVVELEDHAAGFKLFAKPVPSAQESTQEISD